MHAFFHNILSMLTTKYYSLLPLKLHILQIYKINIEPLEIRRTMKQKKNNMQSRRKYAHAKKFNEIAVFLRRVIMLYNTSKVLSFYFI